MSASIISGPTELLGTVGTDSSQPISCQNFSFDLEVTNDIFTKLIAWTLVKSDFFISNFENVPSVLYELQLFYCDLLTVEVLKITYCFLFALIISQ